MAELYLGLIAAGVVVMASIQVAGIVAAMRAGRRMADLAGRMEQDLRPILANLQKVSDEAARASTQVADQVERLDTLVATITTRVEETAATVQHSILQPIRDGQAMVSALKGIVAGFREGRSQPPPGHDRTAAVDDELFIG